MQFLGFAVGVVHGIFHLVLLRNQDRGTIMDSSIVAAGTPPPEAAVEENPDRIEHTETESESEAEEMAEYP